MNAKQEILNFLKDLQQNNSKLWMDANRERYNAAKEMWLAEVKKLLEILSKHDYEHFSQFEPKQCISRITNN